MEHPSLGANQGYMLFVGNVSPRITKGELRELMEPFGTVKNLDMIKVHTIGASAGFAFVEMTEEIGAARAITELNGKSVDGRCIKVWTLGHGDDARNDMRIAHA